MERLHAKHLNKGNVGRLKTKGRMEKDSGARRGGGRGEGRKGADQEGMNAGRRRRDQNGGRD